MSQLENYKVSRWVHGFHSAIQFILAVTLFLGLNILSLTHFKRYDITEDRRYALSPETISYIQELDEKVRIIITESADVNGLELGNRYLDIKNLVNEYEYIAKIHGTGPLESEYINVYQQR